MSLSSIRNLCTSRTASSNKRGAALILEIIIYLVIVALIAVAVTSGVRAIRDLVFTSHAKGDLRVVQTWAEGQRIQNGTYPDSGGEYFTDPGFILTTANGMTNWTKINSQEGPNAGYCLMVRSGSISDVSKRFFWISSLNPSNIMQSNTATANGGNATGTTPPSGIPGVTCP